MDTLWTIACNWYLKDCQSQESFLAFNFLTIINCQWIYYYYFFENILCFPMFCAVEDYKGFYLGLGGQSLWGGEESV